MANHLQRSVDSPIRVDLTWDESWQGPDRGLITCWERGRERRRSEPELATKACRGELVTVGWKRGTQKYLATWQGLRNEDLDILLDGEVELICTRTGKKVKFCPGPAQDDEPEA
jgi:hypothetical protein